MKNYPRLSVTLFFVLAFFQGLSAALPFIQDTGNSNTLLLHSPVNALQIMADVNVEPGIKKAVTNLQSDFLMVTGYNPQFVHQIKGGESPVVIIGTIGHNDFVDELVKKGKVDGKELKGKYEKYIIQNVSNPFPDIKEALVIAGSDKRGTIYGIYELSKQIGVSPWYYWADVPVEHKDEIHFIKGKYTDGEPAVRYRGIFLNDEAPALSGWSKATFGGFNSKFYEKVFELVLRLKGNYMWPAMWGSAFYDDDPANGILANEMGIIMGTSHHEPMAMAQADWHRRGGKNNEWNYTTHAEKLKSFWKAGIERSNDWERIVTIGMRGDGDEAMSEETNIALLEKIVKDQRKIIAEVTRKKPEKTPQVWPLYKEVQDYYDQGMRVPDDVILLYCDDNWGNIRKLPDLSKKPHKGGYGIYYHFDYVGAPRNSKWINISPVQRIWEQMSLSYTHGVNQLWIVNVGDLKPMEYPIDFFLDMAWNPDKFNAQNVMQNTEKWAAGLFGDEYGKEIGRIINLYSKYNRRVTPEMLTHKTYSLENYNEFERTVNEYRTLAMDAYRLYLQLPEKYHDSYYQLVLYPVDACCNLYEMYYAVARNKQLAEKNDLLANVYADKVKECFERDSVLAYRYNNVISGGKWKHMMDQVRIGYQSWQQPEWNIMPEVVYVSESNADREKIFIEKDGYVSIESENYARLKNSNRIHWEVIPGFGKTKSGVTTFPQNMYPLDDEEIYLEYDIDFTSTGNVEVELLLAPTLNFNENKGLIYEVSFDGRDPQSVNFNGHYRGELGKWQAEHIIRSTTKHTIEKPGKHTLRFRVKSPAIVLQKILINTGGLKPSYLGAPESEYKI